MLPRTARDALVVLLGLLGAVALGGAFAAPAGSGRFAVLVLLAATAWTAGALAGAPLPLGRRRVLEPVGVAVGLFAAFAVAQLVVRSVQLLRQGVGDVLALADTGPVAAGLALALVGGIAEEPLFRGALWDLAARRLPRPGPAVATTALYVLMVGATSLNPALTLASLVMGSAFAWQRVRAGGVLAPALTHATWSTLMVLLLPR